MAAPIIPALNEAELEALLEAAKENGAIGAGYVLLRLPHELKDIFHVENILYGRLADRLRCGQ